MSTEHRSGCLVCSKELVYLDEAETLTCHYCKETFDADARCVDGHYVCDACHSLSGNDIIEQTCASTDEVNPVRLAIELMRNHSVKMHGPEHHYLVPAVLLACYHNATGDPKGKVINLKKARNRAEKVPGGFCGIQGTCGAGIGTGIFVSVMTGSTPLSKEEWGSANAMTSRALNSIAGHGGPRCCKRTSFLAIAEAAGYLKDSYCVAIPIDEDIECEFSSLNKECLGTNCPFYREDNGN